MDTGEATLQGFKYSPTQISAAEDAGLRCCNYAALFSEFTSDCGDGSSVCFQCENVAAPSDCVSDPNTCNPSPSDNSGLNKLCNDLANNALYVTLVARPATLCAPPYAHCASLCSNFVVVG